MVEGTLALLPNREVEAPSEEELGEDDRLDTFLTKEVILQLAAKERIPYVKAMRVFPSWWDPTLLAIQVCHEENDGESEPQCMIVTGPTGAGKSTLVRSYRDMFPEEVIEVDGEIMYARRVLYVSTPSPARIGDLETVILKLCGDPIPWKGTVGEKRMRIKRLFKKLHVELLIVDEIQHFIHKDGHRKVLLTVTDWFKDLIKDTGVACVFVGLPEGEEVLKANLQLGRLFGDPYTITPFKWDLSHHETVYEFMALLQDIEDMLPFKEPSNLSYPELAQKCYLACGGIFGLLMKLIKSAAIQALRTGKEQLDDELLAAAFNKKLAGDRRGIKNPFVTTPPTSGSKLTKGAA